MEFVFFLAAAVKAGTCLLYATLGEIISEKVGHLNLGVEGMMQMGAVVGFIAGLPLATPMQRFSVPPLLEPPGP